MKFYISSFALLALSAAAPVAFGGDPEVRPPLPSSGEVEDPLPLLRSGSKGGSGNEALVFHDLSGAAISSTIDEDLGDTLFDTLFAPHDVSDGALDPPIGEDAGGSRYDGSNGAADPLGSGDEAHLDFGSKRRFLSLKKAPKFSKKFSKKTPKKAKKSKTTPTPSDRANIAGKYTYFPDCKDFIDEVTIWCENDICTFFQEALERLECGEIVEDANRCQLLGEFSYQDKVQSTKLETIDLVSNGICRFKDGDVEHGAPNAVRAEFDPNGTMNLFYSVDGGNSFFTDVRVADQEKPDDLVDGLSTRRRLQGCGGQCGGTTSVTTCSGESFCTVPDIDDLLKGFSLSGNGPSKRQYIFESKNSNSKKYKWVRASKFSEITEYITDGQSAMKSTGVSGELTASYGPLSGSASLDYFKGSSSSEKTFRYTVKLLRQAYNVKVVDTRDLTPTAGAKLVEADGQKLCQQFGTHYISNIVFGATLTISFEFSSSTNESKGSLAADLAAGLKFGSFKPDLKAQLKKKYDNEGNKEYFKTYIESSGLGYTSKTLKTLEDVTESVNAWKILADKKFKEMDEYVATNPNPNGDSQPPVNAIAFIASPIQEAYKFDVYGIGPTIARNMATVGEILATAKYNLETLKITEEELEQDARKISKLKIILGSWKDAYDRLTPRLEETIDDCYKYKQQEVKDLMAGKLKIPDPIPDELIVEIEGLTGLGFISTETKIGKKNFPDMIYQGYIVNDEAWYRGTLKCINDVDFSATDTTWELEKISVGKCLDESTLYRVEGNKIRNDQSPNPHQSSHSSAARLAKASVDDYKFSFAETDKKGINPWYYLQLDDKYKIEKIEIFHAPPTDGRGMPVILKSMGLAKYSPSPGYDCPTFPANGKIFDDEEAFTASFTDTDLSALDTDIGYCIEKGHVHDKEDPRSACGVVHYQDADDKKKWAKKLRCKDPTSGSYEWYNPGYWEWLGLGDPPNVVEVLEPGKSSGLVTQCNYYKTTPGGDASASYYDSQRQEFEGFEVILLKGEVEKVNDKLVPRGIQTWTSKPQKGTIPAISTLFPGGKPGNIVKIQMRGNKTIRLAEIRVWAKY